MNSFAHPFCLLEVNDQAMKQFVLTSRRSFHLNASELVGLLPRVSEDVARQAFALFDPTSKGVVDCGELLGSLVVAAPHLSRDTKFQGVCHVRAWNRCAAPA